MSSPEQSYHTKAGYQSRKEIAYFVDNLDVQQDVVHQPEAYAFATHLARQFACKYIIDVGCGQARKLAELQAEFEIIGIDYGENIAYCRRHYNFGQWIDFDLEDEHPLPIADDIIKQSIVICADVIEHMHNPDCLLFHIKKLVEKAKAGILTSPDRDALRGVDDMGPPGNPHHVREWNLDELRRYVEAAGIHVHFAGHTINNDLAQQKTTSILVLDRMTPVDVLPVPDDFTVIAIVVAYNEADVITEALRHLHAQGVQTYLIDNWSDDGTYEQVVQLQDQLVVGVERFPKEPPMPHSYDLQSLLERVEQVAATLSADWLLYYDVDEIREAPWQDRTLREALYYIDQMGFNAIDHIRINFTPVDNRFATPNHLLVTAFDHFQFGKRVGHFIQIKGWKNSGQPISLVNSGGHRVEFEGRRVYPYRFLIKHYPLRSKEQAVQKIRARQQQASWVERNLRGWHRMYDGFDATDDSLFDEICHEGQRNSLIFDASFYEDYLVERLTGIGLEREAPPLAKILRITVTRYLLYGLRYLKRIVFRTDK